MGGEGKGENKRKKKTPSSFSIFPWKTTYYRDLINAYVLPSSGLRSNRFSFPLHPPPPFLFKQTNKHLEEARDEGKGLEGQLGILENELREKRKRGRKNKKIHPRVQ